ncbi:quinol-cytochrome oxidoreductase complex cytochrome b subunit [Virgibacillus natechei]|uniref:Quinol-cytochrome oxidoreductase complex cytochrome b subunit n=1 Tax=Virgibacillus natechei TaxID=1216297 RepID=A0ABS4IBN8_9BACI|nr:hypothetical protein [Virgibacillus natechei]MBP1968343.1 quinol-cytochrome oxidoreductase complex cytochrome b subunit [Virgibacillus natechei]UZD13476.1 hypothetical protein OLD84_02635 [Virgibacillus natechei]
MSSLYFVGALLVFVFITYLFLKNDLDENNKLTKKGKVKFGVILLILFISIIALMTIIDANR